ncbi:MAG: GNAT family N-acetyltransferase [Syntrophomonadaceae bacterium]|jgi:ribosomal protein S18 acetylase RimI-like enzyme
MDNYKVQKAQLEDIHSMLELWGSTSGIQIGLGDDEGSLQRFLALTSTICLVIKEENLLVATIMGTYDGRRGFIYHLAVRPEYQKKGLGKKLLESMINEFKKQNVRKINLFVKNDNRWAMEFYQRQGWEKRQDIQVYSFTTGI